MAWQVMCATSATQGLRCCLKATRKDIQKFHACLNSREAAASPNRNRQIHRVVRQKRIPNFTIIQSSQEAEQSGSIIPPDIAICNPCLQELRDPKNPRYDYFFITCTDCGPRFTIIERLPYDRENTTMREFPLCGFCQKRVRGPSESAVSCANGSGLNLWTQSVFDHKRR